MDIRHMNLMPYSPVAALLCLAACAQAPVAESRPPAAAVPVQLAAQTTPADTLGTPMAATPAASETKGLTAPLLYSILLGDIAAQRGEAELAAEAYADLALKTRDARLVRRAVELSVKARKNDMATGLAQLWVELEPEAFKARQLLVNLLMAAGAHQDARVHLRALLALKDRTPAMNFMHMQTLLGRPKDKAAALSLVQDLAAAYAGLPEARYAIAQAATQAERADLALRELDEALRLRPEWEPAALFRGQLLLRQGDAALLAYWKDFLRRNPDAAEVRMAYAKALAKGGQYREARAEFAHMLKKSPDNPEVAYAIALLSMQINDMDGAETHFQRALKLGYPDEGLLRMYLAQVSETGKRFDEALKRYDEIVSGERVFEARLKAAVLLGKLKRVAEARARLAAITPGNDREKVQVVQAEAQMLRESGDLAGAYAVLDAAVRAAPDNEELLYDRAMAAEKIDRLDVVEADLRRLIKLDPDHAHAYNALGYTLADRTGRIDEALVLIEQALKLAPEDAFILDSMGWALFKARRLDEAEKHLRRAYVGRADPEIAAHLGEVLWQRGQRDEARKLWSEAAKLYPDNGVLRETMARLQP
jgi:tetratricopeptide (TPR) repeat protein